MLLPSASAPQSNITTRKSQLLSNIEELERNREHRRTQQGNARKQREMKMQIDPGNSNWEFLAMIRDYQAQLVYRPLRSTDPVVDNRICVCVRKRPLGKKEMMNKEVEVVTIPSKNHVIVHQVFSFNFNSNNLLFILAPS
jgi:kinesin family member 2/24